MYEIQNSERYKAIDFIAIFKRCFGYLGSIIIWIWHDPQALSRETRSSGCTKKSPRTLSCLCPSPLFLFSSLHPTFPHHEASQFLPMPSGLWSSSSLHTERTSKMKFLLLALAVLSQQWNFWNSALISPWKYHDQFTLFWKNGGRYFQKVIYMRFLFGFGQLRLHLICKPLSTKTAVVAMLTL